MPSNSDAKDACVKAFISRSAQMGKTADFFLVSWPLPRLTACVVTIARKGPFLKGKAGGMGNFF